MGLSRMVLAASAAGLIAGGCTHLSIAPDRMSTASNRALSGASYSLPMLQYDITATRTLVGCPDERSVAGVTAMGASLGFKVGAAVVADYVPGESYVVDYESLSNWFKTSSFAVERYPSGTLKSINAQADDHTAEVVKAVVKTAILAGSIAGGPGSVVPTFTALNVAGDTAKAAGAKADKTYSEKFWGVKGVPKPPRQRTPEELRRDLLERLVTNSLVTTSIVVCEAPIAAMVTARKANREGSKTKVGELAAANKRIADLTTLAGLKALGPRDRAELRRLFTTQETLTGEIADLDDGLAELDKSLAVADREYWPRDFSSRQPAVLTVSAGHTTALEGRLELRTDARVFNGVTFAQALKALTPAQREDLRSHFAEQLAPYFDAYGGVLTPAAPLPACVGPDAAVHACVQASVNLTVQFDPSNKGLVDCGPTPAAEEECVRILAEADTGASEAQITEAHKRVAALSVGARDETADAGVFVREPALARLIICRRDSGACGPTDQNLALADGKAIAVAYAPQFGQLRVLPFRNGPFVSNALSVTLADDGRIQKIEYKNNRAVAQALAETAADVASQIDTEQTRREKEAKDARADARTEAAALRGETKAVRQEEIDAVQAQIDLKTKTAALLKLQAPPGADAAIDEEIARNKKEAELLNSRLLRHDAIEAVQKAGLPSD